MPHNSLLAQWLNSSQLTIYCSSCDPGLSPVLFIDREEAVTCVQWSAQGTQGRWDRTFVWTQWLNFPRKLPSRILHKKWKVMSSWYIKIQLVLKCFQQKTMYLNQLISQYPTHLPISMKYMIIMITINIINIHLW